MSNTSDAELERLLKRELRVQIATNACVGQISFVLVKQARHCEGILTPSTESDWQGSASPMIADYYVRGYCGPSTLSMGSIAIEQEFTIEGSEAESRICCLDCAIQSGVVRSMSTDSGTC